MSNLSKMMGVLLLGATGVHAQSTISLNEPFYAAALPQSGAYFDPEHPGTGMFVDMRKDGSIFIHIAVYDAAGQPIWYAMQDRFHPAFAYPLNLAGVPVLTQFYRPWTIGDVVGPVYRAVGGQCLGCDYSAPQITEAPEIDGGTIEWTNSANARVNLGHGWINMVRLPLDGSEADKIVGTWRMQVWDGGSTTDAGYPHVSRRSADSVVEIRRTDALESLVVTTPAYGQQTSFPDVSDRYTVDCISGCTGALWDGLQVGGAGSVHEAIRTFIWLDASTGLAGIEQYGENEDRSVELPAFRYTFSLHPAGDVMWGRRAHRSFNSAGFELAAAIEGSIVRMDRVAE